MSTEERIRIEVGDLTSPAVEAFLQTQQAMKRNFDELPPQPLILRILYSSWLYLALASGLGALLGWAVMEPFFDDQAIESEEIHLGNMLLFPTIAGFIGLFLGAGEGIMCRNLRRAAFSGIVGLGIGFAGGYVADFAGNIVFIIMCVISSVIQGDQPPGGKFTGLALLVFIMGRAAAWAITSIPAGMGQGIALKDKRVMANGAIGAILGGLLGGLLFDPISFIFTAEDGSASLSRAIGFVCIGLMVGLFVGLVEGWTKSAWLMMRTGPLSGKQFILFRDATVLGSSPKADIYLFKDEAIEPRHALIYNRGGRFEIEDCNTRDGTYVNGVPIKRQLINNGDKVVLGKTILEFMIKDTKN